MRARRAVIAVGATTALTAIAIVALLQRDPSIGPIGARPREPAVDPSETSADPAIEERSVMRERVVAAAAAAAADSSPLEASATESSATESGAARSAAPGPYRWSVRIVDGETHLPVARMKLEVVEGRRDPRIAFSARSLPATRSRELVTDDSGIGGIREMPLSQITVTSADRFRWLVGETEFEASESSGEAPTEILSHVGGAAAGSVSEPFREDPAPKSVVVEPVSDLMARMAQQATGVPLPRFRSPEWRRSAAIGPDGRFEVTGLPIGHDLELELRSHGESLLHRQRFRIDAAREVVQLAPIFLPRRGKVRLVAGPRPAGAGAGAVEGSASFWRGADPAAIDVQFGDLAPGIVLESVQHGDKIVVDLEDYRTQVIESVVLTGDSTTIVVPLDGGIVLEGMVTAADGTPVAGAEVDVHQLFESRIEERSVRSGGTDVNGRFHFSGLKPGHAWIHAWDNAGLGHWSGKLEIRVPREAISIRLTGTGTVRFRLLAGDKPYPEAGVIDVEVTGETDETHREIAVAHGTGRFELKSIPPGTTTVTLRSEDMAWYASFSTIVVPGRFTDVGDVALVGSRRASGVVFDARSGKPIRGARVRRASEPLEASFWRGIAFGFAGESAPLVPATTMTDDCGRFEVKGLAPAERSLRVSRIDYRSVEVELGVAGAESELQPIRLEPRTAEDTVAGRVVDSAGSAVAGATVRLFSIDACCGFEAACDAAGAFRLRYPFDGVVRVTVQPPQSRLELQARTLTIAERDRPAGEWVIEMLPEPAAARVR